MFGWVKRKIQKPIVINLYTYRSDVYHSAPVRMSKHFVPSWFRKLSTKYEIDLETLHTKTNMRFCAGLTDLIGRGFIIPLWSDVRVQLAKLGDESNEYRWQFADGLTEADVHKTDQRGDLWPEDKYAHIKFYSPWIAECSEPTEFVWQGTQWHNNMPDSYFVPPAVVNFQFQSATNVNIMFIRKPDEMLIDLKRGTPLAQIIPITDKPYIIQAHLISKDEWDSKGQTHAIQTTFGQKYLHSKKNPHRRCPYSTPKTVREEC